jgi:hypothetical protein
LSLDSGPRGGGAAAGSAPAAGRRFFERAAPAPALLLLVPLLAETLAAALGTPLATIVPGAAWALPGPRPCGARRPPRRSHRTTSPAAAPTTATAAAPTPMARLCRCRAGPTRPGRPPPPPPPGPDAPRAALVLPLAALTAAWVSLRMCGPPRAVACRPAKGRALRGPHCRRRATARVRTPPADARARAHAAAAAGGGSGGDDDGPSSSSSSVSSSCRAYRTGALPLPGACIMNTRSQPR